MPIPLFVHVPNYPFRVLPEGIHEGTWQEMSRMFIDEIGPSEERYRLYLGLARLASVLDFHQGYLWVNGSFVTDKPTPQDIDVSFFLDADAFDALPASAQQRIEYYLGDKERCLREFHCDVRRFLLYPSTDPAAPIIENSIKQVYIAYARTNPEQSLHQEIAPNPKGFLRLPLQIEHKQEE
jgi:hypothetical protein